ncbi:hypothetical protein AX14_005847 [Amanita brunnescens Koide BX004]|nr:hypothetical protein AX14_005847 [Amanita brunnescens Koide BX004]
MKLQSEVSLSSDVNTLRAELAEAKAVSARLSGMYEQKSKDYRESELERLSLLGKQIITDGNTRDTNAASESRKPRPSSRWGRQRSCSTGRASTPVPAPPAPPVDESTPSSQPFWQDEPLFTKHVAAVTTATMSTLPHLPFETAIANAFTTVRNVGPPPPLKLDKKPGNRRSGAPSPPTPAPPANLPHGNFTFADMVKAATAFVASLLDLLPPPSPATCLALPLPSTSPCDLSLSVLAPTLSACRAIAPGMVSDKETLPGLPRPKTTLTSGPNSLPPPLSLSPLALLRPISHLRTHCDLPALLLGLHRCLRAFSLQPLLCFPFLLPHLEAYSLPRRLCNPRMAYLSLPSPCLSLFSTMH